MSQMEPEAADGIQEWITLLQGHVDEYGGQLGPADFDSYQADLGEIAGVLRDHRDQAAQCQTNLIELVGRYPSVGEWLVGVDPTYRDVPGVNEPAAVEPAVGPGQTDATATEPVEPAVSARPRPPAQAAPAAEPSFAPAPAAPARAPAAPALAVTPPAAPSRRARRQAAQAEKIANPTLRLWTPDSSMQVGKEIVTAIIALVIIASTVYLVARSFGLIGKPGHISQAKDLIGINLGLTGTVLGYYFGRVPAEARATTAMARADQATAEKERVKATARGLADNLDDIMSPTSMNTLTLTGDVTTHQEKLRGVRKGLRDIAFS